MADRIALALAGAILLAGCSGGVPGEPEIDEARAGQTGLCCSYRFWFVLQQPKKNRISIIGRRLFAILL